MNIFEDKKVKVIGAAAKEQGVRAFIAGGAARDLILNTPVKDIDFLIEGSAIDFAKSAGFKIKSIHESFNTVKAQIIDQYVDIASARSEIYPSPGCLPVVERVGIPVADDLKRRDFTVNSIAIDIISKEIIDPFNGEKDIKRRLLRVLHNKSFIDDPARILRGLDFKYRFGFDFAPETKTLVGTACTGYDNAGLSIDRIYLTLNKIFSGKFAPQILKEILKNKIYKIWMKNTDLTPESVNRLENAAKIFNIENKSALFIMALEAIPYIKAPLCNEIEIFNFFKKFNPSQLAFYYFKTGDRAAIKYLELKNIKPLISGKTLIEKGYTESRIIGQILNAITKEKVLNKGALNSQKDELDFAFKHFPPC